MALDNRTLDLHTLCHARGLVRNKILSLKDLEAGKSKEKLLDGVRVKLRPGIEVLSQLDLELTALINKIGNEPLTLKEGELA